MPYQNSLLIGYDISALDTYKSVPHMTAMDRKELAKLLGDAIEELALKGVACPESLITAYDAVEENDRRAMAILTLSEQAELTPELRDVRYKWLN